MRTIGLEEHFWTPEIDEAQAEIGPEERDDNISLFHTPETKARLEEAPLPLEVKNKIAHGNAEKLLKLG